MSDTYTGALDMCTDGSIISNASYLASPRIPAGLTTTGSCVCTAEHVDESQSYMEVFVDHILLSGERVCNDEIRIYKNGHYNEHIVSKCAPSNMTIHLWPVRNITISYRKHATESRRRESLVYIGIAGKF